MTNSQSDIDELKTLQREAAELRAERKRPRATAKPDAPEQPETAEQREETAPPVDDSVSDNQTSPQKETTKPQPKRTRTRSTAKSTARKTSGTREEHTAEKPSAVDSVEKELPPEADKSVRELAVQIESVVKEMEAAARERPALALLAAFTIGIVVGQLFARR